MKKLSILLITIIFFVFSLPAHAGETKTITKVDPKKFQKLTSKQKEKFKKTGKKAQRAAQESIKDYNEVEREATKAKENCTIVRDLSIEVGKGLVGGKKL